MLEVLANNQRQALASGGLATGLARSIGRQLLVGFTSGTCQEKNRDDMFKARPYGHQWSKVHKLNTEAVGVTPRGRWIARTPSYMAS